MLPNVPYKCVSVVSDPELYGQITVRFARNDDYTGWFSLTGTDLAGRFEEGKEYRFEVSGG